MNVYTFSVSFSDVPLSIFYLSFYCNNRTRFFVSAKIFFLGLEKNLYYWAHYIEQYIYKEEPTTDMQVTNSSIRESDGTFKYDSSKFWNAFLHQVGYIFLSPFLGELYHTVHYFQFKLYPLLSICIIIGIGEIANAFKVSLNRDFGWFGNKNKISLVKPTFDQRYPDTN